MKKGPYDYTQRELAMMYVTAVCIAMFGMATLVVVGLPVIAVHIASGLPIQLPWERLAFAIFVAPLILTFVFWALGALATRFGK